MATLAVAHASGPRAYSARQRFQREWWVKVRPALQECDALATRRNEFGDLFIEFWPTDDRSVAVSGSKQLSADVRRCAASALKGLARELKPHIGEVAETHGIAPIGRVRPLLPLRADLLPAWLQATRGGAGSARARQTLRRLLPPDVVVDRTGCLQVAPTRRLGEGVDEWLKANTKPVHSLWLNEARIGAIPQDVTSAYVLTVDRSYLVLRTFFPQMDLATETYAFGTADSRRAVPVAHRLCVDALGGDLLKSVSTAIGKAGSCWRGSPEEILVAPTFEFPRERSYKTVRTATDGRACALDVAGALTCCGRTTVAIGAGQTFVDIDTSAGNVCMVGAHGTTGCSSLDTGRSTVTLPGVFTRVSSALGQVCGVRTDGAVVCSASGVHTPPQGRFTAVDARSSCASPDGGGISCWSGGRMTIVAERGFSNLASDARGATTVACALDRAGAPWCWNTSDVSARPSQEQTMLRFSAVDVTASGRCGLAKDGCDVRCWFPDGGAPALGGQCLRQISREMPSCGVTAEGRAVCEGHPLWRAAVAAGRP
jgi:hypothetical protein